MPLIKLVSCFMHRYDLEALKLMPAGMKKAKMKDLQLHNFSEKDEPKTKVWSLALAETSTTKVPLSAVLLMHPCCCLTA